MVAAPQIGFAQEAIASAPPPYSEYAPPPQVNKQYCTRALNASLDFYFPH